MLRNYFKTALRSLLKNKGFSVINILGLGSGIASFVLIALYVYHETSFDRFHAKGDRIYRIVENLRTENELLLQGVSSPPMGPAMQQWFPEVESYVRYTHWNALVKKDNLTEYAENCLLMDSTFFDVFSFPLLKGDPSTALDEPYSIVLTASASKKYFGSEEALGQSLTIDKDVFTVTGIASDVPDNAHFHFNMLVSFNTWSKDNKGAEHHAWFWNGFNTYLLLREGANVENVRARMGDFITKHIEKGGMYYEDLPLQQLATIYMHQEPRSWENGKRGSLSNVYALSIIAAFILLIAGFNYVNLATARASRRLKEVGLRKVLGAQRRALIGQFLGESMLVSILATTLGFVMATVALPYFNTLVETQLSLGMFPSPVYVYGSLIILALTLGLLSGLYPSLVISGFHPLQMFRLAPGSVFGHVTLRKILVSVQFVISITLAAGTLLVFDQLELMQNRDLGFNKETTLVLPFTGAPQVTQHIETVKDQLKAVPGVISITASHTVPGESTTNLFTAIEQKDGRMAETNINTNFVDADFFPAYNIPMVAGRNFIKSSRADDTTAFVINETAARDLGMTPDEALGKRINQNGRKGEVIGVVKDFNYRSLHHSIEPLIFHPNHWSYGKFSLKIKTTEMAATLDAIGTAWKNASGNIPYEYEFLDESYVKLYKADAQLGKVAGIFSGLAIFVGCLGLLGLTAFAVERRVKEIGIRKVLGAGVPDVILIISREFMVLIAVSFVIAIPITWYVISRWLTGFIEKIPISPVTFIIAGLAVLAIAWITMSFLSYRAATANPAKALRSE
jgi:putative ABC transport system permease protein